MAGDRDIVKQLQRRLGNWDPDAAVRYYWTGQWHKQCEYNEQGQVIQLYLCKLTLVQIPSEVWLFPALQFLYLSDNQLSTLPAEIGQLAALQFLDLDNNHLSTLPAEIGQLSALRVLYLSDNPLQIPPPEIIAQPTPAILAYLRTMQPIKIFYCYAHEDKDLRDRIDKHLGVLTRLGRIVGWYDREIQAGTEWEREIEGNLNTANIILLLVSADFVASDYCYGVEMQKALEMHEKGRARVLPILLRPVDWRGAPFAKLQLLPSGAKPITRWSDPEEALEDVAKQIRVVVTTLRTRQG
jgi:Leucine-rich repeat (LRR) protein